MSRQARLPRKRGSEKYGAPEKNDHTDVNTVLMPPMSPVARKSRLMPTPSSNPPARQWIQPCGKHSASGLHPVPRLVGGSEKPRGVARVIGIQAHADARAAAHLGPLPVERRDERAAHPLADDARRVGTHVGLEQHHELVAAEARDGVD